MRTHRRLILSTTLGVVVLIASSLAALSAAPVARAASCGASTVTLTPMQSPDGSKRPMYVDISHGATKGSGYVGYELTGAVGVLGSDVWVKLSSFTAAGGGASVVGLAANQSASIPVRATSQSGKPLVYAYLTASATTATEQDWNVEVWNGKPGQAGSTQVCTQSDGFSEVDNVISASSNKITSISVSTGAPAIGGSFDVTAVGNTGTMGAGPSTDQSGGNGVLSMAPAMDNSWPADTFTLTGVQIAIGGSTYKDKLRIYPGTAAAGAYTAKYSFTVRGTAASATAIQPVQNIASGTPVKYTGSYSVNVSIPAPVQTTTLVKSASSFSAGDLTYQVVVSNTSSSPVTLDYVQDTPAPTSGWSLKSGTATLGGLPIADPVNAAGTLIFQGPFTVPAASGATAGTLTFSYALHLTATVTNSVVGSVGGQTFGAPAGTQNQVVVDPSAPVITTGSLPDATNGTAYSQTLGATSGTAPYTWSISAGALPAGLALNASTGTISGTPTTNGTTTFTVLVTDNATKTASKSVSITVSAPVVTDTTAPTGSLTIDGGAAATSSAVVTLALSATDAIGVTGYRIAEGSSCASASWVAVSSTTALSVSTGLALSAADGSKTVCAQFEDAAGNLSSTATSTIVLDTVAPSATLASAASSPTNATSFAVTATFSEPVTGLSLAGISVGNGAASGLTGSGTSYSFTVTPAGDGSVTVDLPAGGAADSAGNANTAAAQLARVSDRTRPAVTLSTTAASPTNASSFAVTATFSEPVTGFSLAGVSVGNGSASGLLGSGTTYTFTVTPAGDGVVAVDLAGGSASDAAANVNTAAAQLSLTSDRTPPTVLLTTTATDPTNAASLVVTAAFSEPVSGFSLAGVSVGNGAASALSGGGASYTFTVTPSGDGVVTVDLAAASAADAAGNLSTAAAQLARTSDRTPPSVTLSSAAPSPTNASGFTVTATFSEPVSGLALGGIAVGNGSASSLAGSGTTYTFTVTAAGDGAVTVDLPAGGASDAAGNANAAAGQLSRTVDTTPPSVALSSGAGNPTSAASFVVTATFSEPVSGFTLGGVTVGNGTASSLSGSGSAYTFTVTPAGDGDVTVDVAAGSANDTAGNSSTAAAQLSRTVDTTRPSVTLSSAAPSLTNASSFSVTATFSSAVTGFALGDVAVGNGTTSGFSGSGATYTFTVTPTADGTVTVDVPASVADDAAGNANTAAAQIARTVDTSRPSVVLTTSAADPTHAASFTVTATFSEPVSGFAVGALTVGNGAASALTGSGATYSFTVTAAADGAVTVDLGAGAANDAAGNASTAAAQLTRTVDTSAPAAPAVAPTPVTTTPVTTTPVTTAAPTAPGPTAAPDVKVAMVASSSDVTAGKLFTTTVTATNVGDATANDVTLKIDLPPNTEFVSGEARLIPAGESSTRSASADRRTLAGAAASFPCSVSARTVSCPVGHLDPAARYVVDLTLRATETGEVDVVANSTSTNARPAHGQVHINVRPAKVEITVELRTSRSLDQVRRGEIFAAIGTVRNVGETTAQDVVVTFVLPGDVQLVAGASKREPGGPSATFDCSLAGKRLTCAIGTLTPNGAFIVHLRLRALRSGRVVVSAVGRTRTQRSVRSRLLLHVPGGRACSIYGTTRVVHGTPGDDIICLSPGFHVVFAGRGNDVVYGNTGSQIVYGGAGDDVLYGAAGSDYLDGGPGRDRLYGGLGDDKLLGRSGDDLLDGGPGRNRLYGGVGRDRERQHRGDLVFELAPGATRRWVIHRLADGVPVIVHLLPNLVPATPNR